MSAIGWGPGEAGGESGGRKRRVKLAASVVELGVYVLEQPLPSRDMQVWGPTDAGARDQTNEETDVRNNKACKMMWVFSSKT